MITAANITMQFGAKPLFENISVKFGDGNRYGLIGANGCGKSTFMKILDGSLTPTAGNVSVAPNCRIGKLHQDQFAFDQADAAVPRLPERQSQRALIASMSHPNAVAPPTYGARSPARSWTCTRPSACCWSMRTNGRPIDTGTGRSACVMPRRRTVRATIGPT